MSNTTLFGTMFVESIQRDALQRIVEECDRELENPVEFQPPAAFWTWPKEMQRYYVIGAAVVLLVEQDDE